MKKNVLTQIFENFNASNKALWQQQATADLKGKALGDLDWQINDHLKLEAYYTQSDLQDFDTSILKTNNPDWQIGQHYNLADYKASNKEVLADLNHGLNAPCFSFKNTPSLSDLEILFEGVGLQYIFTHFTSNEDALTTVWNQYLDKQNIANAPVYFGINHFDASKFYEGTANIHKEIKATIDAAKQVLAKSKNLALTAGKMHFTFYVDKSYLVNVAKLRAFKVLWVKLMKELNLEIALPFIKVEFAPSAYGQDEHDNLINATSMAMSAVLGGANHLIVRPTNETPTAKRLARNVQLILKHESGLHKIADPAFGSYYIENLTGKLVGFCEE